MESLIPSMVWEQEECELRGSKWSQKYTPKGSNMNLWIELEQETEFKVTWAEGSWQMQRIYVITRQIKRWFDLIWWDWVKIVANIIHSVLFLLSLNSWACDCSYSQDYYQWIYNQYYFVHSMNEIILTPLTAWGARAEALGIFFWPMVTF